MIGDLLTAQLGAATVRMDSVLNGLGTASPEALNECARLAELACQELARGIEAALGAQEGRNPDALAAALKLRTKVRRARRLLESAYRFHGGGIAGPVALTGGYLPGGQSVPCGIPGRLCLRG